jgi:hypothetical protein
MKDLVIQNNRVTVADITRLVEEDRFSILSAAINNKVEEWRKLAI